jgi:hypothetical protein
VCGPFAPARHHTCLLYQTKFASPKRALKASKRVARALAWRHVLLQVVCSPKSQPIPKNGIGLLPRTPCRRKRKRIASFACYESFAPACASKQDNPGVLCLEEHACTLRGYLARLPCAVFCRLLLPNCKRALNKKCVCCFFVLFARTKQQTNQTNKQTKAKQAAPFAPCFWRLQQAFVATSVCCCNNF